MKKLDLSKFTGTTLEYAKAISKKDGTLLVSKPNRKGTTGEAKYIWRMVVFMVQSEMPYSCMPCTADFDIDAPYNERREITKELDKIVDEITNTLPNDGVLRWGRALGYVR